MAHAEWDFGASRAEAIARYQQQYYRGLRNAYSREFLQQSFPLYPPLNQAKRVVIWNRKTAKSGKVLNEELVRRNYSGPTIIWGRYNNKRIALQKMKEAGVPIPELTYEWPEYPCVGRPDHHQKGKRMYRCPEDVKTKKRRFKPTHFLRWIDAKREYRVHVVDGLVIKYSEKKPVGNYESGAKFYYPWDLGYYGLRKLEKTALDAVNALGFDFGAVDIIEDEEGKLYVLEVNTAPRLTDTVSDTLNRYAEAFMRRT